MVTHNQEIKATPFLLSILIILTITLLGACGKDEKNSGATASPVNGGSSTIPGEIGTEGYLGGEGIPTGSLVDLKDPETLETLKEMMGASNATGFLDLLTAMDNPASLTGLSGDLSKTLGLLQLLTQQADSQARQEFAALLKLIASELMELRKNYSKDKMKSSAKRWKSRMAGIAKGCANRKSGGASSK